MQLNPFHQESQDIEAMFESEIEQVWLDEAERRANEIDQGLVQLIPAEEVSRKARALLSRSQAPAWECLQRKLCLSFHLMAY